LQESCIIRRACRAQIGLGQIRIGCKIKPRRTPLDPAKDQLLDGVEAGCASRHRRAHSTTPDGIFHSLGNKLFVERLHQSKHLDELPLAATAHPGFEKAPEMFELLGQWPAL
jgi:hypothetical protein